MKSILTFSGILLLSIMAAGIESLPILQSLILILAGGILLLVAASIKSPSSRKRSRR